MVVNRLLKSVTIAYLILIQLDRAETGQGVVPDPNDFKLVINDLN